MFKSIAGYDNPSVLEAVCHNSKNLAAASCRLEKKEHTLVNVSVRSLPYYLVEECGILNGIDTLLL